MSEFDTRSYEEGYIDGTRAFLKLQFYFSIIAVLGLGAVLLFLWG